MKDRSPTMIPQPSDRWFMANKLRVSLDRCRAWGVGRGAWGVGRGAWDFLGTRLEEIRVCGAGDGVADQGRS
jgi:hypothetical protein